MPNYCYNELTVMGPEEEIDRFFKAASQVTGETKSPFSLQSLFPIPDHLDPDKSDSTGWYKWCLENWGTKWDIMRLANFHRFSKEGVFFTFMTAWSPPAEAFTKRIAPDYPRLTFALCYEEPGVGLYGEIVWQEGQPHKKRRGVLT